MCCKRKFKPEREGNLSRSSNGPLNASAVRHYRTVGWREKGGEDGEREVESVMVTQPTVERL